MRMNWLLALALAIGMFPFAGWTANANAARPICGCCLVPEEDDYVQMEIKGLLQQEVRPKPDKDGVDILLPREFRPKVWTITANGARYDLELGSRTMIRLAMKLEGQKVILKGRLVKGKLQVSDLQPAMKLEVK